MESVCELARFSPNPFAWRRCACENSKNLQRGGGIVDMSDLMDDKLVATHDWRNWASCRIAGQAGHGGGEDGGEAGPGQAPGHAGRGADDQQEQADPGCRRRLQRRGSAAALTAVMSAPGPGFGLLRSASAAG